MTRSRHLMTAFAALLFSTVAMSGPAMADTPLDGSTWDSTSCHFNTIIFYSEVGANLGYKGDASLLGWQEPFSVDSTTYTVTIAPRDATADEDNDRFTGLYSASADGKLQTLVGYHFWHDTTGTHNERCSYTLTKMEPAE